MIVRIVERTMTCAEAPSQWELRLSDNRAVYVRYRHAQLTIGIGATLDEAIDQAKPTALSAPFAAQSSCDWSDVEPYVLGVLSKIAE